MTQTLEDAQNWCADYFDGGAFKADLSKLVNCPTESQTGTRGSELHAYLRDEIGKRLCNSGFKSQIFDNPVSDGGPIFVAHRIEDPARPTVLIYGHGDVVHGQTGEWSDGRDPFVLSETANRYYGRGVADNKGQHLINIAALEAVIAVRGHLGFNVTVLMEMSEEIGSVGLEAFCAKHKNLLRADVLIASDGPRVTPDVPTIFLGSRGSVNFSLRVDFGRGANHSGNWGGLLRDPAVVLAHAIASITDVKGRILVPEWRPESLSSDVKGDLAEIPVENALVDPDWGESGLTAAEKVFGWNSFAVLAVNHGTPNAPQNAIAGHAEAVCQLRFVVGTDEGGIIPALRRHLDEAGFADVDIISNDGVFPATRSHRDNPWVDQVASALEQASGQWPHILSNLAGWIPNHCFQNVLGLPTVWVPHSYRGCSQHAPNEHLLKDVCKDALRGMVTVFWQIGASDCHETH